MDLFGTSAAPLESMDLDICIKVENEPFFSSLNDPMLTSSCGSNMYDSEPFSRFESQQTFNPSSWSSQASEPLDFDLDDEEEDVKPSISSHAERGQPIMKPEQPLPAHFHQLSDQQLATIDFKELMKLMVQAGLSQSDISEAKARRRRLKNRLSARLCSNKKRERCIELMDTNRELSHKVKTLDNDNKQLLKENSELRELNAVLAKSSAEASQECLQLRDQVARLTRLLVQTGMFSGDNDDAAFAA